jgi:hypothetical protein
MDKVIFSTEVCEQLAQQLVTEQAEIVKREAIVEGLRKTLVEKKKSLIRDCVDGQMFKLDDKKYAVLHLRIDESEDELLVCVTFGECPDLYLGKKKALTKAEQDALAEYTKAFDICYGGLDKEAGDKACDVARRLVRMKHGLNFITCRWWTFYYEDFNRPGYFKSSGLTYTSASNRDKTLLEKLTCYRRDFDYSKYF